MQVPHRGRDGGFHFTFGFTYDAARPAAGAPMNRDPMLGPPPAEVPLPDAPLVRVISQVRFATLLRIDQDRAFVAGFQNMIRERYPFLSHEKGQQISVGPTQALQVQFETLSVWRFADAVTDWRWRVSLGPDFLSLETKAYRNRDDFLERFAALLAAAERALKPGPATRVGLRYVDRLKGEALDQIETLVDPHVLGLLSTPLGPHTTLSLGENVVLAPEDGASVRLRFGLLPSGTTIDPGAIDALPEQSWVLDIDMYDETQRPFTSDVLAERARTFAQRIYTVFRELVTPAFLRYYGGDP